MVIKARLYKALEQSGKIQADVAREVGVSTAAVAQWFSDNGRDKVDLKHKNIVNLAKCLKVSVDWLEGRDKPNTTDHSHSDIVAFSGEVGERNKGYTDVQSYELWSGEVSVEARGMTIPVKELNKRGLSADDVVSIEIPDDSQGPRILQYDYGVIARRRGEQLKNDTLYAVKIGGTYTLRLLSIQSNGDLKLACRNPAYNHAEELIAGPQISSLDILGEYIYGGITMPVK